MSSAQMRITVFFAANGLIMTLVAVVAGILYFYGCDLEPYVAGYVVSIPEPDQIWRGYVIKRETTREVEVACFRLPRLRKLAPAVSPNYFFKIEAEHNDKFRVSAYSDKITVSTYVANQQHQSSGEDLTAHAVGVTWDRTYCFEMPGTIGDDQAIRVTGYAQHVRLLFGKPVFWKSVTPTPEFVIKPTACYVSGAAGTEACR